MTNEEAIRILEEIPSHIGKDVDGYELRAIRKAIETLEKQIPKKPDEKDEYFIDVDWVCPTCGELYNQDHYSAYCPSCGQKIDWSGEQ